MQNSVGDLKPASACGDSAVKALVACPGCDLLHRKVPLSPGSTARCHRCGHRLYANKADGIERALALTLASFVLFVVANTFPFMAIEIQGIRQEISVLSAAVELFHRGQPALGLFAAAVIFVFPLLQLLGMMVVLLPLYRGHSTAMARRAMRLVSALAPWSMMEIYLLGVLVSLVKLAAMADLALGTAFWAFAALVVTNTWAATAIDRHCLWEQLEATR
jgi:paraquat-inducible protein A